MNIYVAGRQFGKTTMLIKESARTGATIAVANYQMVNHVRYMAACMELDIPEPVTYAEVFKTYRENKTKRYLVDELQMMLRQLNVDTATVNLDDMRYLDHWKYHGSYQPKFMMYDELTGEQVYGEERKSLRLLKFEIERFVVKHKLKLTRIEDVETNGVFFEVKKTGCLIAYHFWIYQSSINNEFEFNQIIMEHLKKAVKEFGG